MLSRNGGRRFYMLFFNCLIVRCFVCLIKDMQTHFIITPLLSQGMCHNTYFYLFCFNSLLELQR